ncbi:hypothetical protein os1_19280 [Comamonadaceae bacterium OS-1]|nr:hypothetical protein os1_19280 [Comamonadaceae bacterium OS-1]
MSRKPVLFTLALVAALLTGVALPASALAPAAGKTILTVTGLVGEKNTETAAVFDLAMLEKLPQQTFTTHTPWDKQPVTFTGPLLRDVLAAVKASGTQLKAMALNDYQTTIPMDDAQRFDVIVAYKLNGEAIPVKTKGPLFIVYPFDSKTELQTTRYYERSAWQLKSIKIE